MKKARIAQLKDQLSRYLDHVRNGETVIVLDRDRPIARLAPLVRARAGAGVDGERLDRLERAGLIRRGTGGLPEWLGKRKPPRLRGSVLKDLLTERKSAW